jgi:hypothetical protein
MRHLLLRISGLRVFLKHALPGPEVLLRQQRRDEPLQPLGSGTRAQERRVPNSGARVAAILTAGDAPASGREHAGPPREDVGVDPVQDRGVAGELAREGRVAADHAVPVVEREVVRVLHRRGVPGDEVQVAVDGGVAEPVGVAGNRVEVALWGRDEVGVVHEHGAGEVVPPHDQVLHERTRQNRPRGTCIDRLVIIILSSFTHMATDDDRIIDLDIV